MNAPGRRYPAQWLITLLSGSAFLVIGWLAGARSEARTGLDPSEMRRLRGTSQDKYEGTFSCNALTVQPCTVPGANCQTCTVATYPDVGSTTGGGKDPGLPNMGHCGDLWDGICDLQKVCVARNGGDTGLACNSANGSPRDQSGGPGGGGD